MKHLLNRLAVLVAIAVIAAACGDSGSGSEPEDASTPPVTEAAPGDTKDTPAEEPDTPTEEQPDTPSDASETLGTVTIEGKTYEFGMNAAPATCKPDFFGGFFAVLYTPDLGGNFSIELSNGGQVGTASMSLEVDGETLDLEADPEKSWPAAEAGSSFVEGASYEGNRAVGTAHFINSDVAYDASLAPLSPIIAEFEVVCVEE